MQLKSKHHTSSQSDHALLVITALFSFMATIFPWTSASTSYDFHSTDNAVSFIVGSHVDSPKTTSFSIFSLQNHPPFQQHQHNENILLAKAFQPYQYFPQPPQFSLHNNHFSDPHLHFDFAPNGHITPDYSNGLDYPDPYLRTGPSAQSLANYLYSRELFFGDIPHLRAILNNQKLRQLNGLAGNRLGSLRPNSPFLRGNKQHIFY